MNEIWKDVKGYSGKYCVSNLGRVKTFCRDSHGIILKQNIVGNGYLAVILCNNNKRKCIKIHSLVAKHFLESSHFDGAEVNHKDGNKINNCVENLEWCTSSQNALHAYKTGLQKPTMLGKTGKLHNKSMEVNMLSIRGKFIRKFGSLCEAGRYFNGSSGGISLACRGKGNTSYGYKWEYARVKE